MHQSGRVAIMLEMRSSPQAGSHFTFLISSSARLRRVPPPSIGVSMEMNHCSVARKMIGIVAAPAMRIGVLKLFRVHQHAARLQQFDDRSVGFEHLQAVVFRQAVAQSSSGIHVACGIELVLHAGREVLGSVGRRGVDHAGAGIHRDVISQHPRIVRSRKG